MGDPELAFSAHEPDVIRGEAIQVREHETKLARRHAHPPRKRCAILIDTCCGNPAPFTFGVARPAKCELRVLSIHPAAVHRTSHDEVMAAPRVVGTGA